MQSTAPDRLSAAVGALNLDIEALNMPENGHLEASYCLNINRSSALRRNFPSKLFEVLSDEANFDILQWLPGGKAFIIYDKKRFTINILPHYFKQSQFTSFTRKMSRWSFVRVNRGPLMGAYYHKLFQKEKPALCRLMTCKGQNDRDLDYISASHKMLKVNDVDIDIPMPSGSDSNSIEDMLSFIMLKRSAQEVSIAQQALDERQERINRLLQMQRCKQVCQALGIPVSPDLQLSQLVRAESSAIRSANNVPRVDAFNVQSRLRAQAMEQARNLEQQAQLLARARLAAQTNQLEDFTESLMRSTQLQPSLLQHSVPVNITAESVRSGGEIFDRFPTSAS